jgi:glycosyltransferase involved in cell wall biosynthesis
MIKLSVTIITLNEEKHIGRCIDSVKEIADEVLVVDSFSTDKTEEIALKKGALFIQNKFEGHIEQKNFALEKAKFDHILSLDADEALSKQAVEEILKIKDSDNFQSYRFKRVTSYCGKWIRHCGWYPDKKIRLIDRRNATWGGENPHDRLIVGNGIDVVEVNADILHYSFPTISSHAQTANSFSEIAANQAIQKGKRINFIIHILLNPWFTFLKKYFFQLGFLDGFHGFVICVLSAHSNFLKYTKIWQLQREDSHIKNG